MKDTIHYQIGQQVGDFTISSYVSGEGHFILTCRCGNTSKGSHDHVTRKIANLLSEGYSACQKCTFEYQNSLKEEREANDKIYTYKDVYREYVKKSKVRDIDFSLSLEDAAELFTKPCFYCGNSPNNCRVRQSGTQVFYQGLDRVNNEIGYQKDNIVPCCKYCNSFKMERSQDEFFKHVEKIYFNKVQRLAPQGAYSQVAGNGLHPTDVIVKGEDIV